MTDEFKPLIVEGEEVGEYNDTTFSFDKYQMATVELWESPKEFDAYMTKLDPVGGFLAGKFGKDKAESLVNDFLFSYQ